MSYSSLIELLRSQARERPNEIALSYYPAQDEVAQAITFTDLEAKSKVFAETLREHSLPGDRILICLPQSIDYIIAFFGSIHAGAIPVTAYPPRPRKIDRRLNSIIADSGPSVIIGREEHLTAISQLAGATTESPRVLSFGIGPEKAVSSHADARPGKESLAFLQYTSGSTTHPRGVAVTQGNLLANLETIRDHFGLSEQDRGLIWQPLFHDMGLIGGVLMPILTGFEMTLMAPQHFMQQPLGWLQRLSELRITFSGAPNFAYDLCVQRALENPESLRNLDLSALRVLACGSEPIHVETMRRFNDVFSEWGLANSVLTPCYGLAEATLMVTCKPPGSTLVATEWDADSVERGQPQAPHGSTRLTRTLVSSGRVAGCKVQAIDQRNGNVLPEGRIGELTVQGPSVTPGYWRELQQEAHKPWTGESSRQLRTGDLGFVHAGEVYVTGRIKDVLIVDGRNLHAEDIEHAIGECHPALKAHGNAALCAESETREWLVVVAEVDRHWFREVKREPNSAKARYGEVTNAIRETVFSEFGIQPGGVVFLSPQTLPRTTSGKIQRWECRRRFVREFAGDAAEVVFSWFRPELHSRSDSDQEQLVAPSPSSDANGQMQTDIALWLKDKLANQLGLEPNDIAVDRPLAHYGLDSRIAVSLSAELSEHLGRNVPASIAWSFPTIEELSSALAGEASPQQQQLQFADGRGKSPQLAVIGVSCRFPGASDYREFWKLLCTGYDAVGHVPGHRLDDLDDAASAKVPRHGWLQHVDLFDPTFFEISPREARDMDPQQRVLLELVQEAITDAGLLRQQLAKRRVGVFVGASTNDYGTLLGIHQTGDRFQVTGNARSILANRVSYLFGLNGPSIAVDTACSSSLAAIHLARQSLLTGESDLAIACGVNLILSLETSQQISDAGFASPDGKCKAFDDSADGYVRGEGCGVVILKPLDKALADRDPIHAVLLGTAINNDGRSNGLTAPSPGAQTQVICTALASASIEPQQIQYVEAHGSGTSLGDLIEAQGLSDVFRLRSWNKEPCRIGSVKSNIGHLEAAAGIAGFIKTVLAIKHRQIPPSIHFHKPNDKIPFAQWHLRVQSELTPWPEPSNPLVAGVSSFGFGGTNVHAVLSEAPCRSHSTTTRRPATMISVATTTQSQMTEMIGRLRQYLQEVKTRELRLKDLAYTLNCRREPGCVRIAFTAEKIEQVASILERMVVHGDESARVKDSPKIAFVYSGQGSHHWDWLVELMAQEPVFAETLRACDAFLSERFSLPLIEHLNTGVPRNRTEVIQPLLVAVQIGLTEMWKAWGITPQLVLGHSVGEISAAYAAGGLQLKSALELASIRGRCMSRIAGQGNAMVVGLPAEAATKYTKDLHLEIAAYNSPNSTVLSGDKEAVQNLFEQLCAKNIFARILDGECAFHSSHLDPLQFDFQRDIRNVPAVRLLIPFISTVTGKHADRLDPEYWWNNLRCPVRFQTAVTKAVSDGTDTFLEIGPRPQLTSQLKQITATGEHVPLILPQRVVDQPAVATLLDSLGKLFVSGRNPNWAALNDDDSVAVGLPTAPWHHQRYWFGKRPQAQQRLAEKPEESRRNSENKEVRGSSQVESAGEQPLAEESRYTIQWRDQAKSDDEQSFCRHWIVVSNEQHLCAAITQLLVANGCDVDQCKVDQSGWLDRLAAHLISLSKLEEATVVRLVFLGLPTTAQSPLRANELPWAFCALLKRIQQAIETLPVEVWLVTSSVTASGPADPLPMFDDQSLVGIARVAAFEMPRIMRGMFDIDPGAGVEKNAELILREANLLGAERQIQLRGSHRRVARLIPLNAATEHEDRLRSSRLQRLQCRTDATYLVTGGLGSLGMKVARWLAECGARRLILISRSELPDRKSWRDQHHTELHNARIEFVRELESQGVNVLTPAVDTSAIDQVHQFVNQYRDELWPPIRGVFHLAGVLQDQAIANLDERQFRHVYLSKTIGAWALHREFCEQGSLDHFVLFSSAAAVFGSPGQASYAAANAYLDALACFRKSVGLPALSINWGPWDGLGMAHQNGQRIWRGVAPFSQEEAISLLEESLNSEIPQIVAVKIDWGTLDAAKHPIVERLVSGLTTGPQDTAGPGDRPMLPEDPAEAIQFLQHYLMSQSASLLASVISNIDAQLPISHLGFDSLMVIELKNRIDSTFGISFPLAEFLQYPSLGKLAQLLFQFLRTCQDRAVPFVGGPVQLVTDRDEFPLTSNQRALWLFANLLPADIGLNCAAVVRITGPLDVAKFESALASILQRHALLRATVHDANGQPVHLISRSAEVKLTRIDAAELSANEVQLLLDEQCNAAFNQNIGPLYRAALLRKSADEHIFAISVDHLVSDLWSMAIIAREIRNGYLGIQPQAKGAPTHGFMDYVRWQDDLIQSPAGKEMERYWQEKLTGELPVLNLPLDRPRSNRRTFRARTESIQVDSELAAKLQSVAIDNQTTLFVPLLAAYALLLQRYSGQDELMIGTVANGRNRSEFDELIGFFVNPLALRIRANANWSISDFLKQIKDLVAEAIEHQFFPISQLNGLAGRRSTEYAPLFQNMFIFQRAPRGGSEQLGVFAIGEAGGRLSMGDCELESLQVGQQIDQYDLTVMVADVDGGLRVAIHYQEELFNPETIRGLLANYRVLLHSLASTKNGRVGDLVHLDEESQQLICRQWSGASNRADLRYSSVWEAFSAQVSDKPDARCIHGPGISISYLQLEQWSASLAHSLRGSGVNQGDLVALSVGRTPQMLAALLAIWRCGAGFVFVDSTLPQDRIAAILQDSGASILLVDTATQDRMKNWPLPAVDIDLVPLRHGPSIDVPAINSSAVAYLIYTSGSTGVPKGISISHRALAAFIQSVEHSLPVTERDVFLALTSLSFDISMLELFLPLSIGASVVIASAEVARDGLLVAEFAAENEVTVIQATPSTWQMIADAAPGKLASVTGISGGEPLSAGLAEQLLGTMRSLWNMYGPTETTVWSTAAQLRSGDQVHIGQPLLNEEVYVLDRDLRPTAIGVPGELYIGGDGIAVSYHNLPANTAERFIPNPFSTLTGTRLYRSGDQVLWQPDGTLRFIGRLDYQVKIRGNRIELGDVESILERSETVGKAVVVPHRNSGYDASLIAYVTGRSVSAIDVDGLARFAAENLPAYMVPAKFIVLEAFPETANRKIDRKRLPKPDRTPNRLQSYLAPRNELEQWLCDTWCQVLDCDRVGVDNSFFELGGNSLQGNQIMVRIREQYGVALRLRDLWMEPTIANLAANIQRLQSEGPTPRPFIHERRISIVDRSKPARASLSQERLWFLDRLQPNSPLYNMSTVVEISGELNVSVLRESLRQLTLRHESLRTTFAELDIGVVQVVSELAEVDVSLHDLTQHSQAESRRQSASLFHSEASRTFDLENGPLHRVVVIKQDEQLYSVMLTVHHIIADGWSVAVGISELFRIYRSLANRTRDELPILPIQYRDYAHWQRNWLQSDDFLRQRNYWESALGNLPPALELPFDRGRPSRPSHRGGVVPVKMSRELADGLRGKSRQFPCSLFTLMSAAFGLLLGRLSGQREFCVGAPFANRRHPDLENLIGFLVNTVVLRFDVQRSLPFDQYLANHKVVVDDALENQDVPFEKLVAFLQPKRDLSRSPIFQVLFAWQNTALPSMTIDDLTLTPSQVDNGTSKFDLSLTMYELEEDFAGSIEYSSDLFDRQSVELIATQFVQLLEGILQDSSQPLASISLHSSATRDLILTQWNSTNVSPPVDQCLHELFEKQVEKTPGQIALSCGGDFRTYHQLNDYSNQIAHALLKRGTRISAAIGVMLPRGVDQVAAVLAILKSGCGYLPLAEDLPESRLSRMLQDANPTAVLTNEELLPLVPQQYKPLVVNETALAKLDRDNPGRTVAMRDLGYILGTSGSTGVPKAVRLSHLALANLIRWQLGQSGCTIGTRTLQYTSLGFDPSFLEIFSTFSTGGELVLISEETRKDPFQLAHFIHHHSIERLYITPAALLQLAEACLAENLTFASLREVMAAGEQLKVTPALRKMLEGGDRCTLFNQYGPTETQVVTQWKGSHATEELPEFPDIGTPVDNSQVYLLDEFLEPVPINVIGQLYAAGVCLADGYAARPGLTAERFVPNPFSSTSGARLYMTGDLARYRVDGTIQYLGRCDNQVKIRGFRVEPGEVELSLER
ncbi:MAG: amino acid adenylation domain-containing protein, partial [Planctomycetales bacterium]|nr:amino acid adenylation domain-containing protein [Planctomycetales bacterium]